MMSACPVGDETPAAPTPEAPIDGGTPVPDDAAGNSMHKYSQESAPAHEIESAAGGDAGGTVHLSG